MMTAEQLDRYEKLIYEKPHVSRSILARQATAFSEVKPLYDPLMRQKLRDHCEWLHAQFYYHECSFEERFGEEFIKKFL